MMLIRLVVTVVLFISTNNCSSQHKKESKKVHRVVVNKNKTVITYKDEKVKTIYNDSIGKAVHRIITKNTNKSIRDTLINALSIGVYINGVSFTEHYGELDKGKGNKPTDNTIYEIASVTKTFTGTLVAIAVLEGKLNLEEDIRKYLPKSYNNLEYNGNPIKIRHLITHTSGLPANSKGFKDIPLGLPQDEQSKLFYEIEKSQTKEGFFNYLAEVSIDTVPGTSFNYSNVGTNLMGYIIEKAYNTPFQELLLNKIIKEEVAMKSTKFHLTKSEEIHLANGYNGQDELMPQLPLSNTLWGAEGGLKSTTLDMLKYISYQIDSKNHIVNESHKKLYEIDTDYWIGYFWWIIENQNQDLHYRHDGGALGTRNILLIYPESNIGISIITNKATNGVFENLSVLAKNIYNDLKNK